MAAVVSPSAGFAISYSMKIMEDKDLNNVKIGIIGGDLRQLAAAESLADAGYEVALYGINPPPETDFPRGVTRCAGYRDAVSGSALIALPLPCSMDGIRVNCPLGDYNVKLEDIYSIVTADSVISGGRIDSAVYEGARLYGIDLTDYYERNELCVANAVPTAEGAVAIAMEAMPITIHNSSVIIYGYGRVGTILAHTLKSLGAYVTVAARSREAIAWAAAYGYETHFIGDVPKSGYDVVFNTVPALVLTSKILSAFRRGTPIIELASKPGGIDMKAAAELGLNPIWALSLPGRVAPVTSGKAIAVTLINILNERLKNET